MRTVRNRGVILINARLGPGILSSVRIAGSKISALGVPPQPGDLQIDLHGDRILPGFINSHDHLQLNALPRLKYRDSYTNAAQWIDDIRPRLHDDPVFTANAAVPRDERLLIGGLKNLLSGVTTVAHHDPLYSILLDDKFPVRVVSRFGWSHSLSLDGPEDVKRSHSKTAPDSPWIIHAAEGTDPVAASEFEQLESMGCITANTLLVHGVALDRQQQRRLAQAGAGLIWCPSSNLHLFGRTLDVHELVKQHRVALGSDSRLSGERDLLAEIRVAREESRLGDATLESLVTARAAQLLQLPDRGVLRPGSLADLVLLPEGLPLSQANRTDIRLVMIGGVVRYAEPKYAFACGCDVDQGRVEIDGRAMYLAQPLVAQLSAARVHERGLSLHHISRAITA